MSRGNKFVYGITVSYTAILSGYMLWHRTWFSPDQFFLAAILAAIFLGKVRLFLKDWIPFLLLFFSYEYLHGLAPLLNKQVHIMWMINADKFIFGAVPTIKLQQLLFKPAVVQWYDVAASVLYICHFILPMFAAYVFWLFDRKIFKEYTWTLIVTSFAAFITYIAYPAMPPWMAAQNGYLPPLAKIMDVSMVNLGHPIVLPTIYQFFRGDPVAAVPSLHAAYPLIVLFFAARKFKYWGLLTVPYVAGVWFAVVYLGEHYAIDVILGALYAIVAFIIVLKREKIAKIINKHFAFLKPTDNFILKLFK